MIGAYSGYNYRYTGQLPPSLMKRSMRLVKIWYSFIKCHSGSYRSADKASLVTNVSDCSSVSSADIYEKYLNVPRQIRSKGDGKLGASRCRGRKK
jgi:hypothetical protein